MFLTFSTSGLFNTMSILSVNPGNLSNKSCLITSVLKFIVSKLL
jgi:hypothetical protein